MPNVKLITLSTSVIQANINRVNKIINDLDYYRRGIGNVNKKKIIISKNSYINQILTRASIIDGMPCIKCGCMIEPGDNCYSKYRHRGLVPYPSYYCVACFESLYH